mgnify:FL=1
MIKEKQLEWRNDMNILVIDVGGTFIKYAWMDENAQILDKGKVSTPLDCLDSFLDVIETLWNLKKADGIALSMPGMIDGERGFMYTGGALEYIQKLEMVSILRKHFPVPISLQNDAKCAALAEVWKGNLSDCENGVVLVCGTGIGGAIVYNREVIRGEHFMAGEFSFIQTVMDDVDFDLDCSAGRQCGAKSLIKLVADSYGVSVEEAEKNYTGEILFKRAEEGEQQAIRAIRLLARRLAILIHNLQFIFDPQKFLIGGGISIQPLLLILVKDELKKIRENDMEGLPFPEIEVCKFYNDANLLGALYWWEKQQKNSY